MTIEEAKFILSAYRPDGSDAANTAFGEALGMARSDPLLSTWFERSRRHDAAIAGKLREISPPQGLREAILAGVRVTGARGGDGLARSWIVGLAAAAVLAVIVVSMKVPARPDPAGAAYAGFAISDMANGKHGGSGEPTGALVDVLQTKGARLPGADQIDFERLRDTGCRTLSFAGRGVIEVCFVRDGTLFHLYVSRREAGADVFTPRGPSFTALAGGAAAVWSDRTFDYALASTAGIEALRKLL
jgi:hypothetical protein